MEDKKEIIKAFSRIGIGYGAFIGTTLILQLCYGVIVGVLSLFQIEIPMGDWYLFFTSLANYVVGGFITYLIIGNMPKGKRVEEEKTGRKILISAFFVCMSALYFGNLIGIVLMNGISVLQGRPVINPVEEILSGLSGWTIVLVMVIMAPIFEEILFRRLFIDRIRLYGEKTAIFLSAFVFGLTHGNFYQFFYAFFIGLVLAYIYLRTGKLRYTIFFHIVINFIGSIVGLEVQKVPWLLPVYGCLMLFSVAAGVVIMIRNRKKLVFQSEEGDIWGKGSFHIIFLNVGMIFFLLVATLTFFLS